MTASQLFLFDSTIGQTLPVFEYDVTATTVVLGAMASRDWRPMHHDKDFAQHRNGTRDIFINTPNQAAWFERYLTDWTGPKGRLGRVKFTMKGSVFPGDTMHLEGTVADVIDGDDGCGWVELTVVLTVDGELKTSAAARIALPKTENDNPWLLRGDAWRP